MLLAPTIDIWRPNLGSIGMFALVLGVLLLVWSRASLIVIALSFPDEMPSLQGFMQNALSPRNLEFVLAYFAVGGFFATLVFAIAVVSVPMMLDRNTDGIVAALTSLRVCRENVLPMTVWAALIVILMVKPYGLFGTEEEEIIRPAMESARRESSVIRSAKSPPLMRRGP